MTNDYDNDDGDGDGNAGCDGKSPIEEILGRVPRYKFVTELKNLGEIIFFCREIESVARSSEFWFSSLLSRPSSTFFPCCYIRFIEK